MTVTFEQWQRDIENTKGEIEAYCMIAAGHKFLAYLPENIESGQAKIHWLKAHKYQSLTEQATEVLKKIQDYKGAVFAGSEP